MFDRKDISAVEARGLVEGICWDVFVDEKIKQCNKSIRYFASKGYREVHIDIWTKEQYVWDTMIEHFKSKGFEVKRDWWGIILKW